jgi:hypothetical protein
VVVDEEDAFGPEPTTAATDAPTTAMNAREASARFVRLAGLAPLAMTTLSCGTQPVAESAHGSASKYGND